LVIHGYIPDISFPVLGILETILLPVSKALAIAKSPNPNDVTPVTSTLNEEIVNLKLGYHVPISSVLIISISVLTNIDREQGIFPFH